MGNEGSWVDFPIPGGSDAKVGSRRYLPFTVASAKVSFPPTAVDFHTIKDGPQSTEVV